MLPSLYLFALISIWALMACSTAEVRASRLADGLHPANAFQVAGFAHVMGPLWSADNDVCVRRRSHCSYHKYHGDRT